MGYIDIHTVETAPEGSKEALSAIEKKYGSVPGVFGAFAGSPALLEAYIKLQDTYANTSLDIQEQQLVLLAASVENQCLFCVPAHSFVAKNMAKVDDETIEAVRSEIELPNVKQNSLVNFTRAVVKKRGYLDDNDVKAFLDAGYTQAHILDVILGVSLKTISNYTSHNAQPPLGMFESEKWEPKNRNAA